ncbi:MAG: T9SS type A sorting domain-containing protein, partial [Bacteroidota bacterium]
GYPNLFINDKTFGSFIAGNSEIYVTGSASIVNGVSFGSGSIKIYAGRAITVEPGVNIPSNVELIAGGVYPACQRVVSPASQTQINNVCNSGSYQSNTTLRMGQTSTPALEEWLDFAAEVYPNPTRGNFVIAYELPAPAAVSIQIFDLMGRQVMNVQSGVQTPGGTHRLPVNADRLADGMYEVIIRAGEFKKSVKLVKRS